MKKRICVSLAIILGLLLGVFFLISPNVYAADHIDHDGHTFEEWTTPNSLPNGGKYYLNTDVTLTSKAVISSPTYLCLNGHSVTMSGEGNAIEINSSNFYLYDCNNSVEHKYTIDDIGLATVDDNLAENYETFTGGYITTLGKGTAIKLNGGYAYFLMYGGTLIGNKSSAGAGIHAPYEKGKIKGISVEGGNIVGNVATTEYAGIMAAANCKLFLSGDIKVYNNRTTSTNVAGVYGGSTTTIKDNVQIFGNTDVNGNKKDLRASGGQSEVRITGEFGPNANIYVTEGGFKNNKLINYYVHNEVDPSNYFKPDVGVIIYSKNENDAIASQKYIVTYDVNGGSAVDPTTNGITALPDPLPTSTKLGYALDGWYYEANYTIAAKAEDEVKADKTLYAKWKLKDEISDAISKIDEIGSLDDVKYPGSGDAIKSARDAYNLVAAEEKSFVSNYQTLVDAETAYNNQKNAAIANVKALISGIGNVEYKQDCKDKIDAARAAYDALANDDKASVDNYNVLESAEDRYTVLTEEFNKASLVVEKINLIGEVKYPDSKEVIASARSAYDALANDEEKGFVSNYQKLVDAEATYAKLKADNDAATKVVNLINSIGEVERNAETKGKIDEALKEYNALTDEQKVLVSNHEKLVQSEKTYNNLQEEYNKKLALIITFSIIGGIVLCLGVLYSLLFFVFNKWIIVKNKPARVFVIGKHKDKKRIIKMTFVFADKNENEIYNKKEDALKSILK